MAVTVGMTVFFGSSPAWPIGRYLWYLFWCSLLALGLVLANWQYQRAADKRQLQSHGDLWRPDQAAQSQPSSGQEVEVQGRWLLQHSYWLDNRQHQGAVGVALITPLITATGQVFLIDRGFVATGGHRQALSLPVEEGAESVRVRGVWQAWQGKQALVLGDVLEGNRLQALQPQDWQQRLHPLELAYPGVLHQHNGARPAWWQPLAMPPERHLGYAMQWLLLALLAMLMALMADPWRKTKCGDQE